MEKESVEARPRQKISGSRHEQRSNSDRQQSLGSCDSRPVGDMQTTRNSHSRRPVRNRRHDDGNTGASCRSVGGSWEAVVIPYDFESFLDSLHPLRGAEKSPHSTETVSRCLNLVPRYAEHLEFGIQEFVQNWYDGARVRARHHREQKPPAHDDLAIVDYSAQLITSTQA